MSLIGDREQDQREVKEGTEKRKGKKPTGKMSEVIEQWRDREWWVGVIVNREGVKADMIAEKLKRDSWGWGIGLKTRL